MTLRHHSKPFTCRYSTPNRPCVSAAAPKVPISNRTDVKSPEAISETVTVVAHKVVGIIIYSSSKS